LLLVRIVSIECRQSMSTIFQGRYVPTGIAAEMAENTEEPVVNGEANAAPTEGDMPAEGAGTEEAPTIRIDVTVVDLNDEQKAHFGDVIEFWDNEQCELYEEPNPEGVDSEHISEAIRVTFSVGMTPRKTISKARPSLHVVLRKVKVVNPSKRPTSSDVASCIFVRSEPVRVR